MLKIFRYEIETIFEARIKNTKGFVAAESYANAAQSLVNYCTPLNGGEYCLTEMNLYEIDSENGIIEDSTIKETFEYEENK